ncbi:MAG: 50S ribosomal protein L21 [Bacteroidia bacterium]|nr:MAG: 50S ribosomal protein L21 [Bacteroidia bacterium]
MYAIVDIAGQQFKVEKDQKLFVHRLEGDEGKKISFDRVLLIDTGSKIEVGNPVVKGASVEAKIVEHMKADKVLVFKKKRRKGYQKLNGHRQYMTQILIEGISEKTATKPSAAAEKPASSAAAEKKPAAATKSAAKTTAAKTTAAKTKAAKTTAAKTTASKPSAAKSTAAKKPAAKKPVAKAAPKKESGKDKK